MITKHPAICLACSEDIEPGQELQVTGAVSVEAIAAVRMTVVFDRFTSFCNGACLRDYVLGHGTVEHVQQPDSHDDDEEQAR